MHASYNRRPRRSPPLLAPLFARDAPQDATHSEDTEVVKIEEEEELSPEALTLFWKEERGLSKDRIRYLIRAAEEHPQLRYPRTVLQPSLAALTRALPDVSVNELVSRFPPLLLLPPAEISRRVAFIHKTLYDLPSRFLATRAAPLLYLTSPEVQARLTTWQALLPGADAARVCRRAIPLLLQTQAEASSSVTSALGLLEAHFDLSPTAGIKVLSTVPTLLFSSFPPSPSTGSDPRVARGTTTAAAAAPAAAASSSLIPPSSCPQSQHYLEVKFLLHAYLPNINQAKLLLASPYLLSLPLESIHSRLQALLQATRRMEKRAEEGKEEAEEEEEEEGGTEGGKEELASVVTLCPRLLNSDALALTRGLRLLREGLEGGGGGREGGRVNMTQLALKCPALLLKAVEGVDLAARLSSLMGPTDAFLLARRCPRIFLKDYHRNLLPKGNWLARALGPPLTLPLLLRDSPQVFFYSSSSLQSKVQRLRRVLPPALDVLAMMRAFPGIACMDVEHNVRLKVVFLAGLFPKGGAEGAVGGEGGGKDDMYRLMEKDPRVLIHGFGRISRAEYVVREGGRERGREGGVTPAEALRAVAMTWPELQEAYPRYVHMLMTLKEEGEGEEDGGREWEGNRMAEEKEEEEEEEEGVGGRGGDLSGGDGRHPLLSLLEAQRGHTLKERLAHEIPALVDEGGQKEEGQLLPGMKEVLSRGGGRLGGGGGRRGGGEGRKTGELAARDFLVEDEDEDRKAVVVKTQAGGGWVRKTPPLSSPTSSKGFLIPISKGARGGSRGGGGGG
ncbi:Hypothetical protein NocV09_00303610 [Nannochloropsis oceanica]